MAEEEAVAPAASASASSAAAAAKGNGENWVEDLQRTVIQPKDTAIRSAPSFQHSSSSQLRSIQDNVPQAVSKFKTYEDAFFNKVKDLLMTAREHPAAVVGVGMTAGLILMRGPRRFLFRHTLGRFQSEEAQFLRAEKNVKDFKLSVDLTKKESEKLLERAALAEKDMKQGYDELMDAGSQLQHLAKSVYKVEKQAVDLVDGLREIPGWEALKLRSEVASMVSTLKQQRMALDKRLMKISELGVSV